MLFNEKPVDNRWEYQEGKKCCKESVVVETIYYRDIYGKFQSCDSEDHSYRLSKNGLKQTEDIGF